MSINLHGCQDSPTPTAPVVEEQFSPAEEPIESVPITFALPLRDEYQQRPELGLWPNLSGPWYLSASQESELSTEPFTDERLLWSTEIGTGYSTPVVGRDHLYLFHRQGEEEIVDCRQLLDGELVWQFRSPTAYACPVEYSSGPYSTPALDAEHVYAWGTEGKLYCISRDTGDLIWLRDLLLDFELEQWDFPPGSSPLIVENTIYLNMGGTKPNTAVAALNTNDGNTLWTALDDGMSYATPRYAVFHQQPHLIVLTDQNLVSLDPESGSINWKREFGVKKSPNRVNAVSPLIVDDKIIVTAGPGAGILCGQIEPDGTFNELWFDRRKLDSQFNNITSVSGYVYGFTSKWNRQAQLRCLSLETGEIQWEWSSILMRGSMIAADGKLYLLGEEGHLGIVRCRPDQPEILLEPSEPLLTKPCYSAPIIADGKFILRDETTLKVYDLK